MVPLPQSDSNWVYQLLAITTMSRAKDARKTAPAARTQPQLTPLLPPVLSTSQTTPTITRAMKLTISRSISSWDSSKGPISMEESYHGAVGPEDGVAGPARAITSQIRSAGGTIPVGSSRVILRLAKGLKSSSSGRLRVGKLVPGMDFRCFGFAQHDIQ